jgi:hypothetical protein
MAAFLDYYGDEDSGTVGALDGPEVSGSNYELSAALSTAPEPDPGYREHISLEESLGAVYGWVWCKYLKSFSWRMLYWPALEFSGEPPQISAVRAGGIWAGFMSEARGLSWDRKSRYGKK